MHTEWHVIRVSDENRSHKWSTCHYHALLVRVLAALWSSSSPLSLPASLSGTLPPGCRKPTVGVWQEPAPSCRSSEVLWYISPVSSIPLTPPWGEGCCRWMKGDQSSVKEIGNSCCLQQRDCFVVLRTGGCIHFGLRLSMLLPVWKARELELSHLVFKEIIIRNTTSWKCSKTRSKRGRNLLHADRVFVCCHQKMYKL